MKKFLITALLLLFSLFSCEKQIDNSEIVIGGLNKAFETDEEMFRSGYVNGKEIADYEKFISMEEFDSFIEDFKDPENPLGIKNGSGENARAEKPFMPAVISMEGKEIVPLNVWYFPVTDGEKYIGLITADCRHDNAGYSASAGFADILSEELSKGDMVIFATGAGIYGMHEDNSVIRFIPSSTKYTGGMTFEKLNMGYNLVKS